MQTKWKCPRCNAENVWGKTSWIHRSGFYICWVCEFEVYLDRKQYVNGNEIKLTMWD